eukprot:scaffold53231_cov30-Tisochrysis_lutea.AAC.5
MRVSSNRFDVLADVYESTKQVGRKEPTEYLIIGKRTAIRGRGKGGTCVAVGRHSKRIGVPPKRRFGHAVSGSLRSRQASEPIEPAHLPIPLH